MGARREAPHQEAGRAVAVATRKWPGLQILSLHLGVFDYTVKVIIGPQERAVLWMTWYFREAKGVIHHDAGRRGLCVHREPYCPVIWLPRKPRTSRDHAVLAHEALHAVGHLTRWAAIEHSEHTEEVFCHALGHLVNGVLEAAR